VLKYTSYWYMLDKYFICFFLLAISDGLRKNGQLLSFAHVMINDIATIVIIFSIFNPEDEDCLIPSDS